MTDVIPYPAMRTAQSPGLRYPPSFVWRPTPHSAARAARPSSPLDCHALAKFGLRLQDPSLLKVGLTFERPAWLFAHRVKSCTVGAFTFFNAAGMTSVYRTRLGRYSQIGESSIIGPPEHPMDWFSNHPFAFTRPSHIPAMYAFDDFARLAPTDDEAPAWAAGAPETVIGHEAYIGAGCFIKRGVTIGDGAVIGARSVVTHDIPPYTIAVGSPAKVIRDRFPPGIVERFQALQWWCYDLAPWKQQVDFAQVEATLDFLEERAADGRLTLLQPETFRVREVTGGFEVETLTQPLYD
ncbi:MAG: CatB-related O-acetyltransferase [Oceanococcaceae bacterium]